MLSDPMCQRQWVTTLLPSLNPCSNGICSLTFVERYYKAFNDVLILVLMEYAL